MYERSLDEAETFLRSLSEPVVAVRQVWDLVAEKSRREGFEITSLPDFTAMLDADRRFQIIPAHTENEQEGNDALEDDIETDEMGQLGFFPEDRVRLKTKPIPVANAESKQTDEGEEVGSIRRRSFMDHVGKDQKIVIKKKSLSKKSKPKKFVVKKTKKNKSKKIISKAARKRKK